MKKISLLLTTLISMSLYAVDSGYVCETSDEYQQYLSGQRETLSNLYASEDTCNQDCRSYNPCSDQNLDEEYSEILSNIFILSESEKNNIENKLNVDATGFKVKRDGVEYETTFSTPVDLSTWKAPTVAVTESNPKISKSYTYGDLILTWDKELLTEIGIVSSYTGNSITKNDILKLYQDTIPGIKGNGVYYIAVDGVKIIVNQTNAPSIPGILYEDSNNKIEAIDTNGTITLKVKVAGVEQDIFNDDVVHKIDFYGDKYTTTPFYRLNATINGVYLPMDGTTYLDNFGEEQPHDYSLYVAHKDSGYQCMTYGLDVNIGGDVRGNLFSDPNKCNEACYVQNSCIEWTPSSCKLTGTALSKPVTDYTGKTLFTQKSFEWSCEKVSEKVVGCSKWVITEVSGDLGYGDYDPGYETIDFSDNFGEALGAATIAENAAHIWSGWHGYCENGIKFDNSWMSDPMELLSLAMMAYTGALQGAYGDTLQGVTQNIQANVLTTVQSVSDSALTWANDVGMIADDTYLDALDKVYDSTSAVISSANEATSYIDVLENATPESILSDTIQYAKDNPFAFTSFCVKSAMVIAAGFSDIDEQDVQNADNFFKATMGQNTADQRAVDYANCMSSIGLSFVNMAASSTSMETSDELNSPAMHPARLTYDQFRTLQAISTDLDIKTNFLITKLENDVLTITPLTKAGLTRIGQAVCAPLKEAYIMNQRATDAATNDDGGGFNAKAMGTAAISMALGYLPPPYNLIASVLFKILTSISNGDACHDNEIAMKWGITQAKTEKALEGAQCHMTGGDCAAKWFWGSCMRDRYYYCCYDQETTRIFVEATKEQLGKVWYVGACNDISIYDLQNISFRKCLSGETPKKDKCISVAKYNELTNALVKNATKGLDLDRLTDQAISTIQLPGQNSPWDE